MLKLLKPENCLSGKGEKDKKFPLFILSKYGFLVNGIMYLFMYDFKYHSSYLKSFPVSSIDIDSKEIAD